MPNVRIIEVASHRNGVSGEPFHAVKFHDHDEGDMLAVVFDQPGACAVLAIKPLSGSNAVTFGVNSYRGDHYEDQMRSAIVAYEAKRDAMFAATATKPKRKRPTKSK